MSERQALIEVDTGKAPKRGRPSKAVVLARQAEVVALQQIRDRIRDRITGDLDACLGIVRGIAQDDKGKPETRLAAVRLLLAYALPMPGQQSTPATNTTTNTLVIASDANLTAAQRALEELRRSRTAP